MYIERDILDRALKSIEKNKVLVILGARRTGKTVLLKQIRNAQSRKSLMLNGEDFAVREILERRTVENYKSLIGDNELLIIDEVQKVPEIGKILKLMIDELDGLSIIVTGSSAFDIENAFGEPLTGRKKTIYLFPFSEKEFRLNENIIESKDRLLQRLVYGSYPELIHLKDNHDKAEYLKEIVNSYLLKDILTLENIKNSAKLLKLLKMIAFQTGNLVSYSELGRSLSLSKNTVEKYLDLLTKVFILYKLDGFSRNLRKELTKSTKWYFFDNGIRNAILSNFNYLENRNDKGILWENHAISERIKFQQNSRMIVNNYFWRTYDKQEIDFVEEREGNLFGFEVKFSKKKVKAPASWSGNYQNSEFNVITPENFYEWVS